MRVNLEEHVAKSRRFEGQLVDGGTNLTGMLGELRGLTSHGFGSFVACVKHEYNSV